MNDYRTLTDLAEYELADLRSRGVAPTDSDIVLISAICHDIESPQLRCDLARGRPVACGNVWLWPLTAAADQWFNETGCTFPRPRMALAYAMANGRGDIETATWRSVKAWLRTVKATRDEIETACAAVIAGGKRDELPTPKNNRSMTHGELALTMMAIHGGTPEMWERHVSMNYMFELLELSAAQSQAEGKTVSDAMRNKAEAELAHVIKRIRERQEGGADGG